MNSSQLLLIQAAGPARAFPFLQSRQAPFLETADPVFHRSRSVTQKFGHFGTGKPLRHHQHAMESMVIPGFL